MHLARILAGVSTLCLLGGTGVAQAAGEFEGVTVNVLTQTGAIQEPLQRRAPEFEKLTGAKINVIAVPFSDLYQKVLTDWASGTNSVDAAVFAPQWMVDYIAGGYLEDLTPRVDADKAIQQDDVGAFFRDFSEKYNGKVYMIPTSLDVTNTIWYNEAIFEEYGLTPPATWDELLAVVKTLNDAGEIPIIQGNNELWPFGNWASHIAAKVVPPDEYVAAFSRTGKFSTPGFEAALGYIDALRQVGGFNRDMPPTREPVLFVSNWRVASGTDWSDVIGTVPNAAKHPN